MLCLYGVAITDNASERGGSVIEINRLSKALENN